MVIFNSYVSLPEGRWKGFTCSFQGHQERLFIVCLMIIGALYFVADILSWWSAASLRPKKHVKPGHILVIGAKMDSNGNVTIHNWYMMVYWRVGCTVQERTSGKTMMVGWVKTKETHGILWYFDFSGLWIVYASIQHVWLISIASKWAIIGTPTS